MANISVTVTDGNNIAVSVTPLPTQVITIDRGIAGPVGPPGPAGSVTSVALSAPALFSVGGSPITGAGTLALTYSGTALPAVNGGTGNISYAVGDLLYASTTTALAKLADVATGNALISGGVLTAPAWGKVGLTTHVSGTLPLANGGTNGTATATAGAVRLQLLNTCAAMAPMSSCQRFKRQIFLRLTKTLPELRQMLREWWLLLTAALVCLLLLRFLFRLPIL